MINYSENAINGFFSPLTSWLSRYCNIQQIYSFCNPLIFSIFRYKQIGDGENL